MAEFYTGKKTIVEEEDFQEEDVWAVGMKERESCSSLKLKIAKDSISPSSSARRIPAAHQSSAPLDIPDWSKIYNASKKSDTKNSRDFDALWAAADDDDDEDSDEMIPPHEFIARRIARSPIVSFSMCEGIGRTLKGRDLSRLRNAILTKTGFLE